MSTHIENDRLALQLRLDGAKSQQERNRLGQFATPSALALDILGYAHQLLGTTRARFLDPAFGTGAFFSALSQIFPPDQIASATGVEIDPHYGEQAVHFWQHAALDLRLTDFTLLRAPTAEQDKPNLIICNPPYVRHHHLASADKQRLRRWAEEASGVALNGLAGLYCYFLCGAHNWLAEGGIAGWLVPSEFMDVRYGLAVKSYLLNRVTLLRVHRFTPEDLQFDDALVSSAIVWFKNSVPPAGHKVALSYGGTLNAPQVVRQVEASRLQERAKWTRSALLPEAPPVSGGEAPGVHVGELFSIKRGIATGANSFFVLTPEQIARHQLPAELLVPVLPSPRYLEQDEIAADEEGMPLIERRLFLLDCDLPEAEVAERYPALWQYLQQGVASGVSARYLARHRSPWYAQEQRPAPPLLCTYMGRPSGRHGTPFRFILNRSRATAPNVYLLLYPKPALRRLLQAEPGLLRRVWQALSAIPLEHLVGAGRVYGGGLYKLEPRELEDATLDTSGLGLPPLARQLGLSL